jgi:23S rRNA (pseudouridine1915-N3)-methyltransferase
VKLVFCLSGKTDRGAVSGLVEEYRKRITRYAPVEIIEAKTLKLQGREGVHVLLSPDGQGMSSEEFARFIGDMQLASVKNLFFYTGGPEGFEQAIAGSIRKKISFSPMTFNHQIIRIMLLEQVYRAFTILNNEPYHK